MKEEKIRAEIKKLVKTFFKIKDKEKRFIPGKTFIQYSGDVKNHKEINASIDSLLDGRLAYGKRVETFEKEFANYLGAKDTVTVSSGSTADLIAFLALMNRHIENPMQRGDEVITGALTFSDSD